MCHPGLGVERSGARNGVERGVKLGTEPVPLTSRTQRSGVGRQLVAQGFRMARSLGDPRSVVNEAKGLVVTDQHKKCEVRATTWEYPLTTDRQFCGATTVKWRARCR